jgi:hypothetical protein
VLDDDGRTALTTLEREFVRSPATGFRKAFLQNVRNDWAFHYLDGPYRAALGRGPTHAAVLMAGVRGMSRYLIVDDLVAGGLVEATADRTIEAYSKAIRFATRLTTAIGQVVDGLLSGLLTPNQRISQRDYTVILEAPLARAQRAALGPGTWQRNLATQR